jgi:glycosyltransferase involved in cell wall biosynthesis
VLEAMATGLPVAASKIPGVTELISDQESGLLFEPGDATTLASQLLRLRSNPVFAKSLGDRARQDLEAAGFTWERCAERYRRLYQECLSTTG